jgi:hypothetical protein
MKRLVMVLLGVFGVGLVWAGPHRVTVNTRLSAPYSPYIMDYVMTPGRTMITLTQSNPAAPPLSVRLLVRLYGKAVIGGQQREFQVHTDSMYQPPRALVVSHDSAAIVRVEDLSALFNEQHLVFEGITKQELLFGRMRGGGSGRTSLGRLPPGSYRICVRVLDYQTGGPLSDPEPHGCSGWFQINTIDPPTIVMPQNNAVVPGSQVTVLWHRPAGVPPEARLKYWVRFYAMTSESLDPERVAREGTPIHTDTTRQTVLVWSGAVGGGMMRVMQVLQRGHRYTVQVTVADPDSGTYFRNDGRSNAVQFQYRQAEVVPVQTSVTGVLKYFFSPRVAWNPGVIPHVRLYPPAQGGSGFQWQAPRRQRVFDPIPPPPSVPRGSQPLANRTIALVRNYYGFSATGERVLLSHDFVPQSQVVLDYATTRADGSFTFDFMSAETTGIVSWDTTISGTHVGMVFKALNIALYDPRGVYLCPDRFLRFKAGTVNATGVTASKVRGFHAAFTVKADPAYDPQAVPAPYHMAKARVRLLRDYDADKPPLVGEGLPDGAASIETTYVYTGVGTRRRVLRWIVAEGETDDNGFIRLTQLIQGSPHNPDDKYWLRVNTEDNPFFNYYQYFQPFRMAHDIDVTMTNTDYTYPDTSMVVKLRPAKPMITGEIYLKRGVEYPAPPPYARVSLFKRVSANGYNYVGIDTTDSRGHFTFSNLETYPYSLRAEYAGFDPTHAHTGLLEPPNDRSLVNGDKVSMHRLLLQPGSHVYGFVENEDGSPTSARVTFGGAGDSVALVTHLSGGRQVFNDYVRSGSADLYVDPDNEDYYTSTYDNVTIPNTGEHESTYIGTFRVQRRSQKVCVRVIAKLAGRPTAESIAGARVQIEHVTDEIATNRWGRAVFDPFTSSGTRFAIRVRGPAGGTQSFEPKRVHCIIEPSREYKIITVELKPAASIFWQVKCNGVTVPDARVFLDRSQMQMPIEGRTDDEGLCVLKEVPIDPTHPVTFRATKPGYVGDSLRIPVTQPSMGPYTLNLQTYAGMDLSKMLEFPLEVEALDTSGGRVRITGAFVNLPSNGQVQVDERRTTRIDFHRITVVPGSALGPGGVPYPVPATLPMATDRLDLDANILGQYVGGLSAYYSTIRADTTEAGPALTCRAYIKPEAFDDPNLGFDDDYLYVSKPGRIVHRTNIPAVTARGTDPVDLSADGLQLRDAWGGPIRYRLYGFRAETDSFGPRVRGDTVVLPSTIACSIKVSVESTKVWRFRPRAPVRIHMRTGRLQQLTWVSHDTFPLEKWKLMPDRCSLDVSCGLTMTGVLDAGFESTAVRVPFRDMRVFYEQRTIKCHKFGFQSLSLNGIVPVKVLDTNLVRFGWDAGELHWGLTALPPSDTQPAAFITGLPAMRTRDSVKFSNLFILSDNSGEFTMMPGAPVRLYDLVSFQPEDLMYGGGWVIFKGNADLGIPNCPNTLAYAKYKKQGAGLEFGFSQVDVRFQANGTAVHIKPDTLRPQSLVGPAGPNACFTAPVVVSESTAGKELFVYDAILKHYQDRTFFWVDTGYAAARRRFYMSDRTLPDDQQKFLDRVHGRADANATGWGNFSFAGWMRQDLNNPHLPSGIEAGRDTLRLVVEGDLVADEQSVGVENIELGFGTLTITFDFMKPALLGCMQIDTDASSAHLTGTIQFFVGDPGWYFFGGLTCSVSGFNIQLALIFGDYDLAADETGVTGLFQMYSFRYQMFGTLPAGYRRYSEYTERFHDPIRLNGFFFEGGVEIPIGVPSIGFNFALVEAHFGCTVGVDLTLGANFNENGLASFDFGLMGFAHIELGVSLSLIVVCTSVNCQIDIALILQGTLYTQPTPDYNAEDYSITASLGLQLIGSATLGGGICFTQEGGGCGGDLCEVTTAEDTASFGLLGTFTRIRGSDDASLEFVGGTGTNRELFGD